MVGKHPIRFIALLSLILIISIRWYGFSGENYRSIISSDGKGYYHYFELLLTDSAAGQKANHIFLVEDKEGNVLNKYFAGTAVLWTPFVLPVYAWYSVSTDTPVNLYAEGFQKAVSLAAWIYLLIGLFALKKLLQTYKLKDGIIAFTLLAFFFGTNLSYYSIIAPSMSHVYSFSLIALFIYFIRKLSLSAHPYYLIFSVLTLALIVLVRPVNGLIVLAIPIVWDARTNILQLIKDNISLILLSAFLFLMLIFIQPLYWYMQTGRFFQWSYAGEGFYFTHPRFFDFLFSFRKGVLIYTPLLILSLLSLIILFRSKRTLAWSATVFIAVLIYFLSSWWNWYYGDSYGSRVMIDFYALFALLFALGLSWLPDALRKAWMAFSIVFIFLNLFQSYQYYHNILSHYDMNWEKYKYTFLKAGEKYENTLGGNDDIIPYHKKTPKLLFCFPSVQSAAYCTASCQKNPEQWETLVVQRDSYPCAIHLNTDSLLEYRSVYFQMQCQTGFMGDTLTDVFWVVKIVGDTGPEYHYAFRINAVPVWENNRRTDSYRFALPRSLRKGERLEISIWNKGKKRFSIENLSLTAYGIVE